MRMSQRNKKRAFRLFANGYDPESTVKLIADSHEPDGLPDIDLALVEKLFEEYVMLPVAEKLRLTLMTTSVSNRRHRLMDDIADLERIDNMLCNADEKMAISLLDLKRKIKERMAKESASEADQPESMKEGEDGEIEEICAKILGYSPSSPQMRR
jgi:hypothetical protein